MIKVTKRTTKLAPFKDIMNSNMSSMVPTIKCEEEVGPEEPGAGLLSVNLSAAVINLLAADTPSATLRTPEIVNDVITMTNPLDQYAYNNHSSFKPSCGNESNSSLSNGSSGTSPASTTTTSPPSVQKTCSELIKAGLKLSIESKRKMSCSEGEGPPRDCGGGGGGGGEGGGGGKRLKREDNSDDDYDSSHTQATRSDGLTPEDEERRRRRRERNKIAATKCRMKKRERTVNLVTESEVLETQNIDLKQQLKELEVQKRRLVDMLNLHAATCQKHLGLAPRASPSPSPQFGLRYSSPAPPPGYPAGYDTTSPYIRPESADLLPSSYSCVADCSVDTLEYMPHLVDEYHRPDSVLSLPGHETGCYVTTDGYLPKVNNLLVPIDNPEQDYYDPDAVYLQPASGHTYPLSGSNDPQGKLGNDRCLV